MKTLQKTAIKKDNKKQTLCQCCSDLEATIPWSAWLYSSSQDSPRGGDGSEDSSVLLCVVFWQNHCFFFASLQCTYFKHKTTTTDKVKEDHDWNKPTPTQPTKTQTMFKGDLEPSHFWTVTPSQPPSPHPNTYPTSQPNHTNHGPTYKEINRQTQTQTTHQNTNHPPRTKRLRIRSDESITACQENNYYKYDHRHSSMQLWSYAYVYVPFTFWYLNTKYVWICICKPLKTQ